MKNNSRIYLLPLIAALGFGACNKQLDAVQPLNYIDQQGELSTLPGILEATNGGYINLQNNSGVFDTYEMVLHNISEFRGNNVEMDPGAAILQKRDAFNYTNSGVGTSGYGEAFWRESYQLIVGVNSVLDGIATFRSNGSVLALAASQQLQLSHAEGENHFLRAFAYFNLVRVFGMPYYNNPSANPGVMIKNDANPQNIPARSTVEQTYVQIIRDLQQAAALMQGTATGLNSQVSLGAVWALLSRVYLYMGGTSANPSSQYNQLATTYADSVINKGGYTLLQGQNYVNMFVADINGSLGRKNGTSNPEIIFAYDHSTPIYRSWINSFYHYLNYYGTTFGGFYPSASYQGLLTSGDLRKNFLQVNSVTGRMETTKYDVSVIAFYASPPVIYLRLAEAYLNRAEAKAKTGDAAGALADLNTIHQRAALTAYTGLSGSALMDSILVERRRELAFEGHSSFDDFRNGRPMIRPAGDTGGAPFVIQPDDPKVVMRIPFDDIATNPKLKQNDQ